MNSIRRTLADIVEKRNRNEKRSSLLFAAFFILVIVGPDLIPFLAGQPRSHLGFILIPFSFLIAGLLVILLTKNRANTQKIGCLNCGFDFSGLLFVIAGSGQGSCGGPNRKIIEVFAARPCIRSVMLDDIKYCPKCGKTIT